MDLILIVIILNCLFICFLDKDSENEDKDEYSCEF